MSEQRSQTRDRESSREAPAEERKGSLKLLGGTICSALGILLAAGGIIGSLLGSVDVTPGALGALLGVVGYFLGSLRSSSLPPRARV